METMVCQECGCSGGEMIGYGDDVYEHVLWQHCAEALMKARAAAETALAEERAKRIGTWRCSACGDVIEIAAKRCGVDVGDGCSTEDPERRYLEVVQSMANAALTARAALATARSELERIAELVAGHFQEGDSVVDAVSEVVDALGHLRASGTKTMITIGASESGEEGK